MNLGPIFFAQPLALLGLIALPIILWLLRATPPEPKRVTLPSLALLDGEKQIEETPDKTPWWILALRFSAAALAIIGFSQPILNPNTSQSSIAGNALVLIDNGWESASNWEDIKKTAIAAADAIYESGSEVYLAFSSPSSNEVNISESLSIDAFRKRLQSTSPSSWQVDHQHTLDKIKQSNLKINKVIWLSDGLSHKGTRALIKNLETHQNVDVYNFAPKSVYAISNAQTSANGAQITLKRIENENIIDVRLVAESDKGLSLATTTVQFESNANQAVAEFSIPSTILNQVARFRVLGSQSAGQVWLWDDTSLMPSVALVDPEKSDQPLLEEFYYVRKALSPYAQMMEGELDKMLNRSPDAIIMGDRSLLENPSIDQLEDWVRDGGALIRFAGPKISTNNEHVLTPGPLRPATRALGGAMAWEKPQSIADFINDKGFANIKTPAETILVKKQILAQPTPQLNANTWARLKDGTPLVTARQMGRGIVILFHVTATPEWSDLPYDGAFIEMLRRATASGNGNRTEQGTSDGQLSALRVLDAYGKLTAPSGDLEPVSADEMATAIPSIKTPAGLYIGAQGSRALNAGKFATEKIQSFPINAVVFNDALSQVRRGLAGGFLMAALGLLVLDLLVSLLISGRLRRLSKTAGFAAVLCASLSFISEPRAIAQSTQSENLAISNKQKEAALKMRFAYVETADVTLNHQLLAGLNGLNNELFRRTSVEPAEPHSIKLGVDDLDLYPMIYYAPERNAQPLPPVQIEALNSYLRNGGSLVIDTRDAAPGQPVSLRLKDIIKGLDVPPLQPAAKDHVLTRSFYLLNGFPGRLASSQVWIESPNSTDENGKGDRVSRVYIGASDWIGAWAVDDENRPFNSMDGQETQREMAYRFGINLVMCILTGNYKEDQVHLPALLDRLDQERSDKPDSVSRQRERSIFTPPSNGEAQNLDDFFESMRRQRDEQESGDQQ